MAIQFKLAPSETYKAKVAVVFRGDFDKREVLNVNVIYKRLPQTELKRLGELFKDDRDENVDLDAQILRDNVEGWEPFKDFGGNEVEFSAEAFEAVLEEPAFRRAFLKKFLESLGDPEAQNRKN